MDPLSEMFEDVSPYNYGMNNPILMIDPTGMAADTTKVAWQNQLSEIVITAMSNMSDFSRLLEIHKTADMYSRRSDGSRDNAGYAGMTLMLDKATGGMGDLMGARSVGGASTLSRVFLKIPIKITTNAIEKVLKNTALKTIQGKVSLPMIERYVRMLERGLKPPPIKVANGVIIDGNHRYVAAKLLGLEIEQVPGVLPSSQIRKIVPVKNTIVDLIDWGDINIFDMIIYCITGNTLEIPYDSLIGVKLDKLNLHRADLENANLANSSLIKSNLRGAFLYNANLENCNLQEANLITTDLRKTNLLNSNMERSIANFASFNFANLENVNLRGSIVYGADFQGAILFGAIMDCYEIKNALLKNAFFNDRTVWPDGFDAIASGAVKL